jgi:transcriptional regulator with XRE-family HTH domain
MDHTEVALIVARNIEHWMAVRGIDSAKLARAAGTNPTGVYDILSGKSRNPRLDTITKIATALEINLLQLFDIPQEPDLRAEIAQLYQDLPPEERKRLVATAKAWKDLAGRP